MAAPSQPVSRHEALSTGRHGPPPPGAAPPGSDGGFDARAAFQAVAHPPPVDVADAGARDFKARATRVPRCWRGLAIALGVLLTGTVQLPGRRRRGSPALAARPPRRPARAPSPRRHPPPVAPPAPAVLFAVTVALGVQVERMRDTHARVGDPSVELRSAPGPGRVELFPEAGFWSEAVPEMPAAFAGLSGFAAVAAGPDVYLIGGARGGGGGDLSRAVLRFSAARGTWYLGADLPRGRHRHAAAYDPGSRSILVAGGLEGERVDDAAPAAGALRFDLGSGAWAEVAGPPGAHVGGCGAGVSLPDGGGFRFYLVGGFDPSDGGRATARVDVLGVPADASAAPAWEAGPPLRYARGDLGCGVLEAGGAAHVAAVGGDTGDGGLTGAVEILPAAPGGGGLWRTGAPLAVPRARLAVAALPGGRLSVTGGEVAVDHDASGDTEAVRGVATHGHDVFSLGPGGGGPGAWETRAPMPSARFGHGAAAVTSSHGDPTVFVFGGRGSCPRPAGAAPPPPADCPAAGGVEGYFVVGRAPLWAEVRPERAASEGPFSRGAYLSASPAANGGHASLGLYHQGTGSWLRKRPMREGPGGPDLPRSDFAAVTVGHLVYLIGGLGRGGEALATVVIYNPLTDAYAPGPALPAPRARHAAATDGERVWVVGGVGDAGPGAPPLATATVLDVRAGEWSDAGTLPDGLGGAGPAARHAACAVYCARMRVVYYVGGYLPDWSDSLAGTLALDVGAGEWRAGPPLGRGRGGAACATVDGVPFVVGGWEGPGMRESDSVEAMEYGDGPGWGPRAALPAPAGGLAAAALGGGRLLAAGGERRYGGAAGARQVAGRRAFLYSHDADAWAEKAPLPRGRFRAAAAAHGGTAFLFGGQPSCPLEGHARCAAGALPDVAAFADPRHPDLYLMAAAHGWGFRPRGDAASADFAGVDVALSLGGARVPPRGFEHRGDLFAGAGYWASAGGLDAEGAADAVSRVRGGAAVVSGHEVLLFGGQVAGAAVKTAHVYDAEARRVARVGDMPEAGYGFLHAAWGGRVFAFGGYDAGGAPSRRLLEYDGRTGAWSDATAGFVEANAPLLEDPAVGDPAERRARAAAAARDLLALADGCAVALGDRIYLLHGADPGSGGGDPATAARARLDAFDPVTRVLWGEPADPEVPRHFPACAASGGRLFVVGGEVSGEAAGGAAGHAGAGGNPDGLLASVHSYSPERDAWAAHAPLPEPKGGVALVALARDRLLAVGGEAATASADDGRAASHTVWEYSRWADAWAERAPVPTRRVWASAVWVDGAVFVFGGETFEAAEGLSRTEPEVFQDIWLPPVSVYTAGDRLLPA